jgi:glycine oxidase
LARYFKKSGTLALAHPQDENELIQFNEKIAHALSAINPTKNIQRLKQQEIQTLEPELTKFHQGYYFSDEAHIDSQAVFNALGNEIDQHMTWHKDTFVTAIKPRQITANNHDYSFDFVFDCRGLGAKSLFSDLRSIRGELIWLHAPEVNIQRPIRFLHPRYSIYLIPRPNHIYLIGASEIESEDNSTISVKTTLELLTAAYYIHPGFADARIIENKVNHRPTLSNHLPKIKYADGMIAINGLYRHGYLISPSLVNMIIDYLNQGIITSCYSALWEPINMLESAN